MNPPHLSKKTQSFRRFASALGRGLPTGGRVLLGLVFFVFGLNGLLNVVPPPPDAGPPEALALGRALFESGYLFQLIKGTEVVGGALLLANCFVPLALVLLAPVVVNVFLFHVVLAPEGWLVAAILVALEALLAFHHRRAYAPLFARGGESSPREAAPAAGVLSPTSSTVGVS